MSNYKIDVLDHGYVKLLNLSGPLRRPEQPFDADSIDPALTARISFNKELDPNRSRKTELQLVNYLLQHNHNTPIEMIEVWLEMKMPIFIARQFVRHRTVSINEVSARYVQLPKEWYIPEVVGAAPNNGAKQGQSAGLSQDIQDSFVLDLNQDCLLGYEKYENYIQAGVAPEHARMFLHVNHYCMQVDTPILTQDLQWVRAGDLSEGDKLLGFEEYPSGGPKSRRKLIPSEVEKFSIETDDLYKITLSNGETLTCNLEHKWLVHYTSGSGGVWKTTKEIMDDPKKWSIKKLFNVWDTGKDYEWGFLSAAFDGEGFLTYANGNGKQCGFSQNENAMLSKVRNYLDIKGYKYSENVNNVSGTKTIKLNGGFGSILEFLGTARPPRLLDNWISNTSGGLFSRESAQILRVESVGQGEIASFQTSSSTYIANGYPCHNTHWIWKQNLHNFMHMLNLRIDNHAQVEAQAFAKASHKLVSDHLPDLFTIAKDRIGFFNDGN